MSIEYRRITKSCFHIGDVILAGPLIVHDVAIFPHFIPQHAIEGSPSLEHTPLVLLTNLTTDGI